MSEKILWYPDVGPDKVGWDLAAEDIGLGQICPV
jgi:hypothetical protein